MSETTKQFKNQLPRNALMAVLSFVTYSLSAIWLTPYLVRHLGIAAYGLVPLAGLFTEYASIISANLSGAVNRFLTVELHKPEGQANVIFNSAIILYFLLWLIQIPIFGAGLFFADNIFSIPDELRIDALILLGCSAAGFLVSQMQGVFGVSMFAKNRIDINSGLNLWKLILRLILLVTCFSLFGAKLRWIGIIDLLLSIGMGFFVYRVWRRLTPELSIALQCADRKVLLPVFRLSFWSLLNQLGSLLYLRTDIWIINRFISPVAAGEYAAVLVIANFVRQIGLLWSGQLGPSIMRFWATDDILGLKKLFFFSNKALTLVLMIPTLILCCNGQTVLSLWLGNDFKQLCPLLVLLVIHLPFSTAIFPVAHLQMAANQMKFPAKLTIYLGLGNVILSYYLGVSLGGGVMGVAFSTLLVLIVRNVFAFPWQAASLLATPFHLVIKPTILWMFFLFTILFVNFVLLPKYLILQKGAFLLNSLFIVLSTIVFGWVVVFSVKERSSVSYYVSMNLKKVFP